MTTADHLYIPRHELTKLDEELGRIPWLSEQLGIAYVKADRLGLRAGNRRPKRPSEQPLPYQESAAEIIQELHHELAMWVRTVLEQRALTWTDTTAPPTTPQLARWLQRNLMSLGLTEGAENALVTIGHVIDRAQRLVTPARRENPPDPKRLAAAGEQLLNANGIATVATELDERYRNLSKNRVHYLARTGRIDPAACLVHSDHGKPTLLFHLGDVLAAHLVCPIRMRHAQSA